MWVFLSDAFLSIVADQNDRNRLLVRARCASDIERVFPEVCAVETPNADYRFRASILRSTVANAMAAQARSIRYGNFKDSVAEDDRHSAYMGVWGSMYRLQQQRLAPPAPPDADLFDDWSLPDDESEPLPFG